MKCTVEAMVLGVDTRENKQDKNKPYSSVEVSQPDSRSIMLSIPFESDGLLAKVRAAYAKTCRIAFAIKPGQEFKQFYLDLVSVEPLPVAPIQNK